MSPSSAPFARLLREGALRFATALSCLALLAVGGMASAADGGQRDILQRITWSEGKGLTRVHFHAAKSFLPELTRTAPTVLRLDFHGVEGGVTPARLVLGSAQVKSVSRLPDSVRHFLPEGVSERFLVNLSRADLGWSLKRSEDGFILFVGDKERVGRRTVVLPASPEPVQVKADSGVSPSETVRVRRGERLKPPVAFTAGATLAVRSGPSALSPSLGELAEATDCVADGQRGGWLHLKRGGWVRHSLGEHDSKPASDARRTPHSWSVVTLGSGLAITLDELAAGEEEAKRVNALLASPWRVIRLTIKATASTSYGYRFPAKEGRVLFLMKDGTTLRSPDPLMLARARGVSRKDVGELFVTPEIHPGDAWTGWIVLPLNFQFGEVEEARVDAAGRARLLFHVPGSGETVGE